MEEGKEIERLERKYKILKEISKFLRVDDEKILNTLKRFKSEIDHSQ